MHTVKLIAYRAETAMSVLARDVLAREDDARALVPKLFRSEADLSSHPVRGQLTIVVHGLADCRSNRAIQHLHDELNIAVHTYPGTNLKLCVT